jgi:hypothetical protein
MGLYVDEDGELRDDGKSESPVTEVVVPSPVIEPNINPEYVAPPAPAITNPTGGNSQDHDLTSNEALTGQGWKQDEVGNWYKLDSSGSLTFKDDKGTDFTYDTKKGGFVDSKGNLAGGDSGLMGLVKQGGQKLLDLFKGIDGKTDWTRLLSLAGGFAAANKPNNAAPTGYQGKIPKLTATSNMLTAPPVGRRPGSGGINYGGGTTYRNEKGEVVSSNEKTLAELRAAAESNPFNRPSTYENPSYGRPPVTPPSGGGLPDIVRPPAPGPTPSPAPGPAPGPAPSPSPAPNRGPATPMPGQYGAIARPGYQQTPYTGAREGTKLPDGRILTAQGIYNPKTGEVITPDGYRVGGGSGVVSANKDNVSAEDAKLMEGLTFSMNPNKEGTPEEVKNFIKWQMSQANPLGQGTMADVYAKQGITDPYSNPIIQQQAQDQLKRQDRRDAMYSATQMGLDPSLEYSPQGYGQWEDPNWQAKQTADAAATAQRNQQQSAAAPNVTVGGGIATPAPAAPPPNVNDWAQTQQGQAAGGINSVYDSINKFLATNPDQEALSGAMRDFGVNEKTLEAAKSYAATPAAPAPTAPEPAPQEIYFDPTAGGGAAKGGLVRDGFVVPADVVSHFGNGSSEAGLKLLASKIGATPIKGDGDGMSDSIKTNIDGVQEARVANDEAYVSPEMVKKLGNGSPEKGARKLYAMMDQIRKARTGTTKQGKEIDPDKFMPGGSVQRYAPGGTTTVPTGATGSESSLSNWAGDYVTNMLGQGAAQANKPYEAYTGPLTAGASGLQNQAFNMASGLRTPGSIGQAAGTAGGIANLAANMQYTPQTTNFLGQPNVSGLGMSPSYGMNQQSGTSQYTPGREGMPGGMPAYRGNPLSVPGFGGGNGPAPFQNNDMNYTGGSQDFDENTGTYRSEDGRGVPSANGGQQPPGMIQDKMYRGPLGSPRPGPDGEGMIIDDSFMMPGKQGGGDYNPQQMDQDRDVFAQKRQQLSQDTLSKIPAYQQLQALQGQFQGGRPSPEQEQQLKMLNQQIQDDPSFQQMTNQQQQMEQQFEQQYPSNISPPGQSAGLPGLMQGRQQPQQPQASQPVGDIAQQYMNPYLESALRPQMAEMQRVADIARVQDAGRLTQAGAYGGSRQAIMESEGRRNLLGKQSEALGQGYATAYDKAMAQFNADQNRRAQEAQFGASFGMDGLRTGLQAAQAQGSLGTQQNVADISNLNAMLTAGTTERGIESEGIAADKAQFEEARLNPYKMVQYQQSLLSGMPLASQSYSIPGQSNLQQFAGGATTVQQLLDILSGKTTAAKKP